MFKKENPWKGFSYKTRPESIEDGRFITNRWVGGGLTVIDLTEIISIEKKTHNIDGFTDWSTILHQSDGATHEVCTISFEEIEPAWKLARTK